jgi:hypothetical protein
MGSLGRDTVAKAFKWYTFRIEAVVAADGDFNGEIDAYNVLLLILFISIKSDDYQLCCVIFCLHF